MSQQVKKWLLLAVRTFQQDCVKIVSIPAYIQRVFSGLQIEFGNIVTFYTPVFERVYSGLFIEVYYTCSMQIYANRLAYQIYANIRTRFTLSYLVREILYSSCISRYISLCGFFMLSVNKREYVNKMKVSGVFIVTCPSVFFNKFRIICLCCCI